MVAQEQHLDLTKQIEDYRSAITGAEARDDVAEHQIGVSGISYSGGHGLILSANESRVTCVVATIPVIEEWTNVQRAHGEDHVYQLIDAFRENRRKRVDDSSSKIRTRGSRMSIGMRAQ